VGPPGGGALTYPTHLKGTPALILPPPSHPAARVDTQHTHTNNTHTHAHAHSHTHAHTQAVRSPHAHTKGKRAGRCRACGPPTHPPLPRPSSSGAPAGPGHCPRTCCCATAPAPPGGMSWNAQAPASAAHGPGGCDVGYVQHQGMLVCVCACVCVYMCIYV